MQSAPPTTSGTTASQALAAFLRGIERRAFVFAELQCGRGDVAQSALGHAMRAFRSVSAITPLSGWPAAFWSLLLAQPELGEGESGEPALAALGNGPRAALLLRLVAGLDFAHAAQVLGVGEATYRFALRRALQQLADAGVSYASLGELRERLHRQVKSLSPERTEALAALRQRVLSDQAEPEPRVQPSRTRAWAWMLLVLLAIAFAASWWWPAPESPGDRPAPQALPEGSRPRPTMSEVSDIVTHPDYAQLAEPELQALAADLALLSWFAAAQAIAPATGPDQPGESAGQAESGQPDPADFAALPPAQRQLLVPLAAAWPGLEPELRLRMRRQAVHWLSLSPVEREALRERIREWDALPAAERARRRAPFAAWQALPGHERQRVRAAGDAWRALPEQERKALRSQFDALPPDQRQDWWLGPGLGADFGRLRPLFAFVPASERAQWLALLHGLDAGARADLAVLARRLPASEREALRRELVLAGGPEQRAQLVRQRLAQ
ncbi:DUF3106 domain-containing protein [Arenimonas fontis]|uniref:DUF3106 domain-containing protein n=1 Tax=Arenimonas fontis TaxID=2608255 RepID=UPI001661C5A2|nr:DUF3106 domain-containing protein [Arenimonas fontis]